MPHDVVVAAAIRLLHDRFKPAVLLIFVCGGWALRFLGLFPTFEGADSDRDMGSIALRFFTAAGMVCLALIVPDRKSDILIVARANPLWGSFSGLRSVAGAVFLVSVAWLHIRELHQHYDILDASEETKKASTKFAHWEDLETKMAMIWMAGFAVATFWLLGIALSH